MGNADHAHENSEYVRRLLEKKYPGFAAVLERAVWELTRRYDVSSSESPTFELPHVWGVRV